MCIYVFVHVCVHVRVSVKRCRQLEVFYSQQCMHQEEVELNLDEEHNGNKGVFVYRLSEFILLFLCGILAH